MQKSISMMVGAVLALSAGVVRAEQAAPLDSYGVKVGVNATTLAGSGADDPSVHLSLGLGAFYNRELIPELRIAAELLMTEKGADFQDVTGGDANEGFLYLQLPVFARYDLPLASRVRVFGFGGPAAGYVIDSKLTPKKDLKRFDVSAIAGAGVEIDPGSHRITVDVRAEVGFLNQLDREEGGIARNRGLSLFAGVSM